MKGVKLNGGLAYLWSRPSSRRGSLHLSFWAKRRTSEVVEGRNCC